MAKYVIDGLFLIQKLTGTQRYSLEITKELDKIVDKNVLEILVPNHAQSIPEYENIKVVKYGNRDGIKWQQIDLARYLRKNKKPGIFFNNVFPLTYPKGMITIHDVCYKVNPEFYSSSRDKLSMMWHRLNYFFAARSKMTILTVSEFSKSEITKYYKVDADRIKVIKNGWQHINSTPVDNSELEKFAFLEKGNYYFSMSTLGANKNFRWILHCAKNNPDKVFAIAGGGKLKGAAEAEGFVDLPNIHFLGYVSDEEAKALMSNCKAFLFPTLYEGFGIPPLEAVACGCKRIIVSDTPCMHEIYGDFAKYIDPHEFRLVDLECEMISNSNELLDMYSWKKSANALLKIIKA